MSQASSSWVARAERVDTAEDFYGRSGKADDSWRRLTDLNPAVRTLKLGRVQRMEWVNEYGATCWGHLILPVDYQAGKRYPAVVMLKDWSDAFILEGQHYHISFAPQILAGQGFIVLMAAAPDAAKQPEKGPGKMGYNFNEMAMVESALSRLEASGMIDKARVGIMGFSVTSWQVQFILTQSRFAFAAASTADGWNLNYGSYTEQNLHYTPHGYDMGDTFDRLYGGPPYGATLRNWLQYAPAFNADRVSCPVLTESVGMIKARALEWFTALHKNGRPVEMFVYPAGKQNAAYLHNLHTPLQRLTSLELNVDWFRFWLQGVERESALDSGRYIRWRAMKEKGRYLDFPAQLRALP